MIAPHLYLTVATLDGTDVETACKEAVELARHTGVGVRFAFGGVEIHAFAWSDPADLKEEFDGRGVAIKKSEVTLKDVNLEIRQLLAADSTPEERNGAKGRLTSFEITEEFRSAFKKKYKSTTFKADFYPFDAWQITYAVYWWGVMLKRGWISSTHNKDPLKVLQQWAEAFDWVVKTFGETPEDGKAKLDRVLTWLFKEDDWWVAKGNVRSPLKFAGKMSEQYDRITYFEHFLSKAEMKVRIPLPKEGEEVDEFTRGRLIKTYGKEFEERFTVIGFGTGNKSNEKVYRFRG